MSPQETKRRIKSFYSLCWRRAPIAYSEPELLAEVTCSLPPKPSPIHTAQHSITNPVNIIH
jgi:hypothetical protein